MLRSLRESSRYATVCVTLNPDEVPNGLVKKVLSISAQKLGSGDVRLASHLMLIVNVEFIGRAGPLSPDVVLIKNSDVLAVGVGGAEAREFK